MKNNAQFNKLYKYIISIEVTTLLFLTHQFIGLKIKAILSQNHLHKSVRNKIFKKKIINSLNKISYFKILIYNLR